MCAIRGANPWSVLCSKESSVEVSTSGFGPENGCSIQPFPTTSIGHCAGTSLLSNPTASVGWRLGIDEQL